MSIRKIEVALPEWLWGRLVSIADDRGLPVAGLIADALRETVDLPARAPRRLSHLDAVMDEIRDARRTGWRAHDSKQAQGAASGPVSRSERVSGSNSSTRSTGVSGPADSNVSSSTKWTSTSTKREKAA